MAGPFFDLNRMFELNESLARLEHDPSPTIELIAGNLTPETQSIAILPGSFNPLTIAHTALASAGHNALGTPVIFVISLHTVDKERITGAMLEDRLLVLEAFRAHHEYAIVGVTNRGLYVDQAKSARRAFPWLSDLWFLVGFDKIVQVFDPRYYANRDEALEQLFSLASFAVAPRSGAGPEELADLLDKPENRRFRDQVRPIALPNTLADVSSTSVRQTLAEGRAAQPDLPPSAAAFVQTTGAYSPPVTLSSGEVVDVYELRKRLFQVLLEVRPWSKEHADFRALMDLAVSDSPAGRALRDFLTSGRPGAQATLEHFQRAASA